MISPDQLRGEVSFTLLSSIGELVQGSTLFWPWLHLGFTFLMVMEPDRYRGVWAKEDEIWDDYTWGKGFVFVWDRAYSTKELWSLSEGLVLGSAIFWPIFHLWLAILLESGGVTSFWGWGKCLGF